jgi:hypothetical protein
MSHPTGNFSFIENPDDRYKLEDAYQAIDSVRGGWALLKKMSDEEFDRYISGKSVPSMNRINNNLKYSGHSGNTIFWTFVRMRKIAVEGWDAFITQEVAAY